MTQLDRIERKLDAVLAERRSQPMTSHEAMKHLNLRSVRTLYRVLRQNNIRAIRRGYYSRNDVLAIQERR